VATDAQSAQQKKRFLAAFARCGNISAACCSARVPRRNVYTWQEIDPAFVLAYREAEVLAKEAVEREIRRRGVEGWLEPVYQGGAKVGNVRRFSDVLLIFLAKRLMPEYRDSVGLTLNQVVREYRNVDTTRP